MKIDRRGIPFIMLLLSSIAVIPAPLESQASSDPCELLPGNPADVESKPPSCIGSYWPRTASKVFGGLYEFGAQVTVQRFGSKAEAARTIATLKARIPSGHVAYGDGGLEKIEKASAPDTRTPTPEEVKAKQIYSDLSDLVDDSPYSVTFSCGADVIRAYANPSKGPAVRQLISEMDADLRSRNLCGSATAGSTTPAVVSVTPPPPVTPPPAVETGGGGGTRYFDGEQARGIQNAQASGSRYMVVLSREWDPSNGCFIEERAWVSGIRASSSGSVGAVVGPSRTVCVKGGVMDQAKVNEAEAKLQNYRNQLAKALQARSQLEPHLKDPNLKAWAAGEIAKVDQYITTYTNYINQTTGLLTASTPP